MIYLDSAATTLLKPQSVYSAVQRAMESMASPGRGAYPPAMQAAELLLDCREEAASLFSVEEPENVVFTMNATHALNIAITSLAKKGSRVVISGFEHNAVTRPLHALGADVVTARGELFDGASVVSGFAEALRGAELAVCTHVSNVFGFILPIAEIASLCKKEGVPLIIDASQSAGLLPIDMCALGAAFIAMPGHKGLHGPQGTGLLLCGESGRPLLYGGSGSDSRRQEMPEELPDRLEAGTHNVPGIAGLLAGLRFVREKDPEAIKNHEQTLLRQMADELEYCEELELFLASGEEQTGVLSLRSRRIDCETLASQLAERGVCVRAGLHCAPKAHRSAGTLESGTVRLSFSPFLSAEQISRAAAILRELLRRPL